MSLFVEKFQTIEKELSEAKGDFVLFALLLREESPGKWDVVISAPWVDEEKTLSQLEYVVGIVKSHLDLPELISVSRVVLLEPSEEFVRNFPAIEVKHGLVEWRDIDLNGMGFSHAYVITSNPTAASASPDGAAPDPKHRSKKASRHIAASP